MGIDCQHHNISKTGSDADGPDAYVRTDYNGNCHRQFRFITVSSIQFYFPKVPISNNYIAWNVYGDLAENIGTQGRK